MAEKDLHIAAATVRESGADQLHVASSAGVMRFATVTEDNAARVPVARYHLMSAGGEYDV